MSYSGRREDIGARVMRFDALDRMAELEADEEHAVEQRVAAWQASLPPVKPDRVLDVGGARVSVYTGEGERELRRRAAHLVKLREGRGSR